MRYPFIEPLGTYEWPKQFLPKGRSPVIFSNEYLDDLEPLNQGVPVQGFGSSVKATQGEWEPVSFVLVTPIAMENVQISVSDLTHGEDAIEAMRNITVRRVVRSLRRKKWYETGDRSKFTVTGRYLPRWSEQNIAAGEFRQIWLSIFVPPTTPAGKYKGKVTLSYNSGSQKVWPITVNVLPIQLAFNPYKSLGMVYNLGGRIRENKKDLALRELRDMASHGVRTLHPKLEIEYYHQNGKMTYDLETALAGLKLLKESKIGWKTVVLEPNFNVLARCLGHTDVLIADEPPKKVGTGDSLRKDKVFLSMAHSALRDLKEQAEAMDLPFNLVYKNLDEILDKRFISTKDGTKTNEVELYKIYAGICHDIGVNLAATISTDYAEQDVLRRELSPRANTWISLLNTRIHHGSSFEKWLQVEGNTIQGYREEMQLANAQGWYYHNEKGSYHTAKWSRIANGIFLWNSPFSVHIPWMYQIFGDEEHRDDSPFNDTTTSEYGSFGFAFPSGTGRFAFDLVPTISWEAAREGWDDLRYFYTLYNMAFRQYKNALKRHPKISGDINLFFDRLRRTVSDNIGKPTKRVNGTPSESPIFLNISSKMDGEDFRALREEAIRLILAVQALTP